MAFQMDADILVLLPVEVLNELTFTVAVDVAEDSPLLESIHTRLYVVVIIGDTTAVPVVGNVFNGPEPAPQHNVALDEVQDNVAELPPIIRQVPH